jgi:hypothetical protein
LRPPRSHLAIPPNGLTETLHFLTKWSAKAGGGSKLKPRQVMLMQRVPNRRNCAMGIQSKERYQSVSDWTASYRRFMDRATAQRHLVNVERHIAAGPASVLRQQEIIERLESAGGRRSETASIARALLHQMERRLEPASSCYIRHKIASAFHLRRLHSRICPPVPRFVISGKLFARARTNRPHSRSAKRSRPRNRVKHQLPASPERCAWA